MAGKQNSTVISVRMPTADADRVCKQAQASGLTRNDYVRLVLRNSNPFTDVGKLDESIDVMRRLERIFDRYLTVLEEALTAYNGEEDLEAKRRLLEEIGRAETLIDLTFRAQKQAAHVLRSIRRRIR